MIYRTFWKHIGTMGDEASLHALFDPKRIRGEWFKLTGKDIKQIKLYFSEEIVE